MKNSRLTSRVYAGLPALLLLLFVSVVLSLSLGAVAIPWREVLDAVMGAGESSPFRIIILDVRLPRTVLALMTGLALSCSGVIFQALLRNPLADPYLLGVSSGAALGSVLIMSLGLAAAFQGAIPLAAMAGGGLAVAAVYFLARKDGGLPPHTLILAGVVISSFCSALVLFLNVLMEARQLQGALFWVMGTFSAPPAVRLGWVALVVFAGFLFCLVRATRMNLLTQGEEVAASLGLDVEREKKYFFAAACLMTGVVVSVSGLIGFVGLVVPHAARMLFGPDHRTLIPASAMMGASFLVLSDVAARMALAPAELPVGVITAIIGAPFFLYLLRQQRRVWSAG